MLLSEVNKVYLFNFQVNMIGAEPNKLYLVNILCIARI